MVSREWENQSNWYKQKKNFISSSCSCSTGKQEKDPNESLDKSNEEGKPEDDDKGGFFKRVSR